jgi:hypothetical protein
VIAAPIPVRPLPPVVRQVCAQRIDYSEYPATCPTVWPARSAALRSKSLRGPKAWFADFGSVRIGGRKDFFPLDAQQGDNWAGAPQLGVPAAPVDSVAKVGTRAALVLVASDRVIVVWNPEGHGTFLSIRLAGRRPAEVAQAALRVAESWR